MAEAEYEDIPRADLEAAVRTLARELQAARAQLAATSGILGIISDSPADAHRVFESIADNAVRLCGAKDVRLYVLDGDEPRLVAQRGSGWDDIAPLRGQPDCGTFVGRALVEGGTRQIAEEEPPPGRAALVTPLLRGDATAGAIILARPEPRPFSEQEMGLVETFAHQAVIAIENARLFSELQERNRDLAEALEQQTATADILRVISNSPADLGPVLAAVAERAARLCDARRAFIERVEGESLRAVAEFDPPPGWQTGRVRPLSGLTIAGRAVVDRRTVHVFTDAPIATGTRARGRGTSGRSIHLVSTAAEVTREFPEALTMRRQLGIADEDPDWSALAVPLLADGSSIGVILLVRDAGTAFTDAQIAFVETFADQAAIAIENARLFTELQESNASLREALEQQTATAEVLDVISRSPTDVGRVLDTIIRSAARLFDAEQAYILEVAGEDTLRSVASNRRDRPSAAVQRGRTFPLDRSRAAGRAVLERRTVLFSGDIAALAREYPALEAEYRAMGWGGVSLACVPLLHREAAVGVLIVRRWQAQPFSDPQVALLETFADQAVIAIENARLFEEIKAKSRELEEVNRQLEDASKHKSAFVSSMSHELRTPLNAIIGFADVLAERMFGDLNEKQAEYLADIQTSARHLLSLISGILDLAKIEAGRMDLYLEEFEVAALVNEVETVARPLAEKNNNTLTVHWPDDLGAMTADQTKVRQALLNLLSNAAKFTEQGAITLALARTSENGADWLTFAVSDTGIGMTEHQQSRLFEAFSQAEAGTQVKYGGTGLGLALSREFCRLMGGDIAVTSAPGEGSTFTIRLPAVVSSDDPVVAHGR